MKLATVNSPVRSNWLAREGFRLDASPYLSGSFEARKLVERLPGTMLLGRLADIFYAGRSARRWVNDPEYGTPFLFSTNILEADFTFLPLMANSAVADNPRLTIESNWSLITRSGTVGRMAYSRRDMHGYSCAEDVLRVAPDTDKIAPGYLYSFLSSNYGVSMITNATYGVSIQYIEPDHIADLPVPRFTAAVESAIHDCVQAAADLRENAQANLTDSTRDLFESAGLPELADFQWHKEPRPIGFQVEPINTASLRAMNYDARAQRLAERISSVPHRTLGEICAGGELSRGNRSTRIPAVPGNGYLLIGQEQLFWEHPEGRWISVKPTDVDAMRVPDETIMIACRGLLTEGARIGRTALVTGSWLPYLYSENLLRLRSGSPNFSNAYLFAFMRSEVSFRILRSLVNGTGQQDINAVLCRDIPVPECTPADRERIAEAVRQAYRWRDEADALEERAQALLETAVRAAAGTELRHHEC